MNRRSFFTRLGQVAVGAALLKYLPASLPKVVIPEQDVNFGHFQLKYNGDVVTVAKQGTYYVYADDPAYEGGDVVYRATQNVPDVFGNGIVFFGRFNTVTP